MKCTKCQWYSYSLRRCRNGKINPRTIKGGVEAASFMGLDYICNYCDLKTKIRNKLHEKAKEGEKDD